MTRYAVRTEGLAWREVGDDVVILDERTQKYLQLEGSGALLWPRLVAGASVDELEGTLIERFGIEHAVAHQDVEAFVADLRSRSLVEQLS